MWPRRESHGVDGRHSGLVCDSTNCASNAAETRQRLDWSGRKNILVLLNEECRRPVASGLEGKVALKSIHPVFSLTS
jgi:hypothetical protein